MLRAHNESLTSCTGEIVICFLFDHKQHMVRTASNGNQYIYIYVYLHTRIRTPTSPSRLSVLIINDDAIKIKDKQNKNKQIWTWTHSARKNILRFGLTNWFGLYRRKTLASSMALKEVSQSLKIIIGLTFVPHNFFCFDRFDIRLCVCVCFSPLRVFYFVVLFHIIRECLHAFESTGFSFILIPLPIFRWVRQ